MLLDPKSPTKATRRLSVTSGLALVASLLFSTACQPPKPIVAEQTGFCLTPALKERLVMESVLNAPITETRRLSGKVEYNSDKVVNYVSLVGGIITTTNFTLGQHVQKGQVLAEIRSSELSDLASQKSILQSQIQVAKRKEQAVQSMFEDGIASERDLLEARSENISLQAELDRTNANLSLFSASSERNVFQIKAPVSGYVVSKNISAGMQIAAEGDPLFTISDLAQVWVTANIYPDDLVFVQEGMEVQIQSSAYQDQTFTGKIQSISQVFDEDQRVLKARIVMENADLRLKPGLFVNILVHKDNGQEAPQISENALIFNNNRNYLVVYGDDCDIRLQQVAILSKNNGNVYLQEGVKPGETVITQNHLLIYEAVQNLAQ